MFLTPAWVCAICDNSDPDSSYTSPEELHLHLTEAHKDQFSNTILQAISRQSRVERPRRFNECPLCCFPVEDMKTLDKTISPKRRREQQRRGCNKFPRMPRDSEPQRNVPEEDAPADLGGSSDDCLEGSEDGMTFDNSEVMARHVATHLQVLMLLSIRIAAVQGGQYGEGDDVNSASADIGDSEVPSQKTSLRESQDAGSFIEPDKSGSGDEASEHANMEHDDGGIPDADVDFDGVHRQYDELAVDEDAFLQGIISSGAFQPRPEAGPATRWISRPISKRVRKRLTPISSPKSRPNTGSVRAGGGRCRLCYYKKRKVHMPVTTLQVTQVLYPFLQEQTWCALLGFSV